MSDNQRPSAEEQQRIKELLKRASISGLSTQEKEEVNKHKMNG